jgi:hypothetical protein
MPTPLRNTTPIKKRLARSPLATNRGSILRSRSRGRQAERGIVINFSVRLPTTQTRAPPPESQAVISKHAAQFVEAGSPFS